MIKKCNPVTFMRLLWVLWGLNSIVMLVMIFEYIELSRNDAPHNTIFASGIILAISITVFMFPILFAMCKMCIRAIDAQFDEPPPPQRCACQHGIPPSPLSPRNAIQSPGRKQSAPHIPIQLTVSPVVMSPPPIHEEVVQIEGPSAGMGTVV